MLTGLFAFIAKALPLLAMPFGGQASIRLVWPENYELREDGSKELRENNSYELRDAGPAN